MLSTHFFSIFGDICYQLRGLRGFEAVEGKPGALLQQIWNSRHSDSAQMAPVAEKNMNLLSHSPCRVNWLDYICSRRRVHVRYQSPNEVHFLPSVLEDDFGILRRAAEEVRREHHRQVRRVHLRGAHDFGVRELLKEVDQVCEHLFERKKSH